MRALSSGALYGTILLIWGQLCCLFLSRSVEAVRKVSLFRRSDNFIAAGITFLRWGEGFGPEPLINVVGTMSTPN